MPHPTIAVNGIAIISTFIKESYEVLGRWELMADRLIAAYRRLKAINLQRLRLYYLSLELTHTLRRNSPGTYLEFTATPFIAVDRIVFIKPVFQ